MVVERPTQFEGPLYRHAATDPKHHLRVLYTDPDVSPLFGDFAGFPPLFLQAGSSEMLRDEAVRTAHKARAAGVDVEIELWPGTVHGFQIASFLPESELALDQIARFVVARTGWAPMARRALAPGPA